MTVNAYYYWMEFLEGDHSRARTLMATRDSALNDGSSLCSGHRANY